MREAANCAPTSPTSVLKSAKTRVPTRGEAAERRIILRRKARHSKGGPRWSVRAKDRCEGPAARASALAPPISAAESQSGAGWFVRGPAGEHDGQCSPLVGRALPGGRARGPRQRRSKYTRYMYNDDPLRQRRPHTRTSQVTKVTHTQTLLHSKAGTYLLTVGSRIYPVKRRAAAAPCGGSARPDHLGDSLAPPSVAPSLG